MHNSFVVDAAKQISRTSSRCHRTWPWATSPLAVGRTPPAPPRPALRDPAWPGVTPIHMYLSICDVNCAYIYTQLRCPTYRPDADVERHRLVTQEHQDEDRGQRGYDRWGCHRVREERCRWHLGVQPRWPFQIILICDYLVWLNSLDYSSSSGTVASGGSCCSRR